MICCRLEEHHASQVKALTGDSEDQTNRIAQMEREMTFLQTELSAQKEANVRSPSNTMKNLVDRLKAQLTQREKQLKVLLSHKFTSWMYKEIWIQCWRRGHVHVHESCVL